MSKSLGSGQAKAYYQTEYTNTRESYYAETDAVKGEWTGALAEEWELIGSVEKEQFERLIDGQDPRTGEGLIKHVSPRKQTNKYGEEIETTGHRAGWDATFSAPKTVSIAALVGGDERLRAAHRESVDAALKELEKHAQARLGGSNPSLTTAKFIAAKFEHDSSRPDRATGYAAPQLHTHTVIFNLTRLETGRFRSMQPLELYRSQQLATAVYRTHLAEKLQELGYEIEVDARTGAPEIKGFSREYIAANSPRREEILHEAQEMKERLEGEGFSVKEGAGLLQAAAKTDRANKIYDREEIRRRHQEMDAKHGYQARAVTSQAIERGTMLRGYDETVRRAQEAVTFARNNATEREAVTDMRRVFADALRRGVGLTTYEAICAEMKAREERGEFVRFKRTDRPIEATTSLMLALEKANLQTVIDGRGGQQPIIEESLARQTIDEIAAAQKVMLNDGQRAALKQMLVSRDRILGLQGGAGTGKTTVLASVRVAAERAGYEVEGFAPTTRAAALLAGSGIRTQTLQRFLRTRQAASDNDHPHLYVLDESSLAGTKNLHQFFARLGAEDRVLLVGDSRQHQAIEAGSPFEQFQRAGMETARLSEIVRQKDPRLKEVVELLAAGDVRQAIEGLQVQGRVIEVADARERLAAIAMDYVAKPDSTLIISPANKERVAINTMVHGELQARGSVSREDHPTIVYVNRQDMTGTERTFANSYVPGEDVIRYSRASKVYGVKAGDYGHVVAKNHEQNTITVRVEGGREVTYNPERLSGVSVYREAERQFAEGDRIQFRAPAHELKVANGELGTLEKIEGGSFTVMLDGGRKVGFDARAFPHLDHGYAVTSYSSQGQTIDRVIVNADTHESNLLLNQRMGYVALSRAREDARVYTDSAEELGAALDRQVHKQMALDALRESRAHRQNGATAARYDRTEERKKNPIHWLHVTAHDPCPVCHKPDNCAVSADGVLAYCRRVDSDRPGRDDGFVHSLSDRPGYTPHVIALQEEVATHDRAPVEHRDEVHQDMLSVLDLKDRERINLLERGMSEEATRENNYKSVPSRILADAIAEGLAEYHDLRGVPGFYREEGKDGEPGGWRLNVNHWHQGLLIPVRDVTGRIEGFQIRRAEVKDDSPRYVWLSSSNKLDGTSSGAPVHFRNVEQMRESGRAIITEGALKGDIIAHYMDRGVITLQGVSSFREDSGKKLREQIPELQKVSIAFDADYVRNPSVERALGRLTETLTQAGLKVETLQWEESEGKGLDDYLKGRLTEHFYHIKGEERASIQADVLSEVGVQDEVQHSPSASFNVVPQECQTLDQNRGEIRVSSGSKGISW